MPPRRNTADDALLDAARDCVLAVGLRRTTLTDVARRAGVSRMTLYRRWPDMATLMGDVMTREWSALTAGAVAAAAGGTARERFVDGLVRAVRALREHPVFRRVLELDPEMLLPYLVDRHGIRPDTVLAGWAAELTAGRADGSLRDADPALLAPAVLRTVQGFVIADRAGTDALDDELRLLLDRYLRP